MSTLVSAGETAEDSPRLRGWLHLYAIPLAIASEIVLIALSPSERSRVGSIVLTLAALANFVGSSAMHLGRWPPRLATVVRRFDHASIFVLIAGSYTPFSLLMLSHAHQVVVLCLAWGGAVLGVSFRLAWSAAPRWIYTGLYLLLGWVAVAFVGDFADFRPLAVPVLLATGGVLYSLGGLVYGMRRPNPSLAWFGFHEVFHALAIAAFAAQFAGVLVATVSLR
ncbi:hemolysin III family protein [Nocardioides mangrovicus]|uniref:Hemolysin III family protein n=1 Tax=Nocardioides mangrovicus TaxID=2478913 RepID=A0A3L8P6E0_9ACTN|nr:hemolysin III family protein [Nocardioides mangrovicus]RLV50825.1 hemolysin III family protein [Nocardioides mangrovicus]